MPVIAMTREIGSLGTDVAAGVAQRLGLEIVRSEAAANHVARRLGVAVGAVTRYLEGSASLLERWQIDRRKLFKYAAEEILGIAQQGNVLIKGWGAATLLRDLPPEVAILTAVSFTVALGFGIVAPVIPAFARQFGVSVAAAASVISVFALMRIVGALPAGRLADRFGVKHTPYPALLLTP